jgi:TolB protein
MRHLTARSRLGALLAAPALVLAACQDGPSPTAPAEPSARLGLVSGGGPVEMPPSPCTIQACLGGGGRIAFVNFAVGGAHIYTVSTAGFDTVRVDKDNSFKRLVTWSPDYTKLAYVADRAGGGYEIFTMNADGTAVKNVRSIPKGFVDGLSWSPDGTKLVYAASDVNWQGDIFMISAGGGAVWQLTNDATYDGSPSFSSDGTRIFFVSARGSRMSQVDVWSMTTAGAGLTRITNTPELEDAVHMSPDGTKLAYHTYVTSNGGGAATDQNKIVIANPDGSGAQVVQSWPYGSALEGLGWSRDGKYLVFAHTFDPWSTLVERWQVGSASAPVALTNSDSRKASTSWHY